MHGGLTSFNGAADNKPAPTGAELYNSLSLLSIMPDGLDHHVQALVGRDDVHSFGVDSAESLKKYRLGGAAFDRSCWAVRNDQNELQSAIYVHKNYTRIDAPRDLAGNVRKILTSEATQTAAIPLSIIFYSITRLGAVKGAGEVLIGKVHERMNKMYPQATVFSTLSPLRVFKGEGIDTFIEGPGMPEWNRLDEAGQRAVALQFLLQKREGVQKFHMGNGAIIGDIKLDADSVGKYRIMVNYMYDRDAGVLKENAARFAACKGGEDMLPLVHPHLIEETAGFFRQRKGFVVSASTLGDIAPSVHAPSVR